MPWQATVLIVVSALTHALWNLLTKRSAQPLASLTWTLLGGSVVTGLRLWSLGEWAWPPEGAYKLLVLGGVAEAVYLYALSRAYVVGDLSLAYPISRGSAPPLVALWAAVFFGERLPWGGYLGIGLLVFGIMLTAATKWSEVLKPLTAWRDPAARWALLSGIGISVFSIVDKRALSYFSPSAYNFWSYVAMLTAMLPLLFTLPNGSIKRTILSEWRSIAFGWLLVPGTSMLVLSALALAPASYVAGLRGLSALAGAMLAKLVLDERVGPVRATAAGVLALGTACLAWAG